MQIALEPPKMPWINQSKHFQKILCTKKYESITHIQDK